MNNKGKIVQIVWNDAKMFSPKNKHIELSVMETKGIFEIERDEYYLIKNPLTLNIKTGNKHPEKDPTYYLIPKSMVISIKYLE